MTQLSTHPKSDSAGHELSAGCCTDDTLWEQAESWESISSSPFHGPDWFRIWLDHFGENVQWSPTTVFDSDRLVGVAPWVHYRQRRMGIPLRVTALAGNLYSPITAPAIAESADTPAVISHMLDVALSRKWDKLYLQHLPEESSVLPAIRHSLQDRGLPFVDFEGESNWYLPVTESADQYLDDREKFSPRYLRRRERMLQRAGDFQIELFDKEADIENGMDQYYQVYAASWQKYERDATFHRDLARAAVRRGWLRLAIARLDQQPIAAQLWLVRNKTAYIVKLCYDQNYRRMSPGALLSAFLFRHVIDHDHVSEIDYLKGDQAYKREWMKLRRTRRTIIAHNPRTLRGRLLSAWNARRG